VHEYSIVSALIAQVDDAAHKHAEPRVLQVRIRVGELAGVDPTLLRTAWELFREGTCCARAELDVMTEPARWACPTCDAAIAHASHSMSVARSPPRLPGTPSGNHLRL